MFRWFLFLLALVVGLVVPHGLRNVISDADVQLPQFRWSKSPPTRFSFEPFVVLRVIGIILGLLAIIRFILVQRSENA